MLNALEISGKGSFGIVLLAFKCGTVKCCDDNDIGLEKKLR